MSTFDQLKATTTDFTNQVPDFIVDAQALDVENATGETFWYFEKAKENYNYFLQIPEIHSSANALATWTTGKGMKTSVRNEIILDNITGAGASSFIEIMFNLVVTKLIVGDAFCEIVRDPDAGTLINLIPVSPERVKMVLENGRIKHYEVWGGKVGIWKKVETFEMLHLMNNQVADEIHGTSQIDACRWVINARNEALVSNQMIERRGRALGIAYYKTNNEGKITYVNTQIEKAVKDGEMLGLPDDTVTIKEFPTKSTNDRMQWIIYLENFFYQCFGVPRIIATSEGVSEVGGKMGYLIFEPVYTKEQTLLENSLWNQVAIRVKFNRPATLSGVIQQDEAKNTGQIGIQPNDMEASMTRE